MKLSLSLKKFSSIINGKIIKGKNDIKIDSLCFDSRKISQGEIFFALKGEKLDANDYIDHAIEKGAKGIVCHYKKISKQQLQKVDFCVETKNTLNALHKLAAYHRLKHNIPIVSVTGANGKTTTKEMIKNVLSLKGKTCSNMNNLNNEYGLPFSVLELDKSHKNAVFEIGASKRGDVAKLASILKPDIAVITTIGPEHLEFFKNMENIYKTETEVLSYLKSKKSCLIFNGDNEYLKRLKKIKIRKYSFGYDEKNDLIIKKIDDNFYFRFENKDYKIKLNIEGEYNYLNAAAAFLVGVFCNIKIEKMIKTLEKFSGVKMRMQKIKFGRNTIFFDAYNANPQSMENAIREIKKQKKYSLVLGDMKELGKYTKYYHKKLAEFILDSAPLKIFLIGKEIKVTYEHLISRKENVKYYSDIKSAKKEVEQELKKDKNVFFLFKASRAMKFENLLPENIKL